MIPLSGWIEPRVILRGPSQTVALPVSILKKGHSISGEIREAGRLTRFAVETRYPGLSEPVTQDEYKKAIAIADIVVRWAEEILKRNRNNEGAETEQ